MVKVPEHEGTCCRVMSLRHVAATIVLATCPTKFNKLNFVRHVAGTKLWQDSCCTKIKVWTHTRACRCNMSLGHVPATFSCV